jgi:CBS domain-containing protein
MLLWNVAERHSLEEIAELMMEKGDDHVFVVNKEKELVAVVSGI